MRYTVEDTREGFRLTTYVPPGPARVYNEIGGHGPIEDLYVRAERTREAARRAERARESGYLGEGRVPGA